MLKHALVTIGVLTNLAPCLAAVTITKGRTPIPAGEAIAAGDITVRNSKLAFSLAVDSAPPWGVARGCIVDATNVKKDGSLAPDRIAFADFIPNNWSSWGTTYQKVKIIKDSPEEAIIEVKRDWDKVDMTSVYSLKADADTIHIETTMVNKGKDLKDIYSGFTLWSDSGYRFAVPGYAGKAEATVKNPVSDRYVNYDKDWSITLHAIYPFTDIKYGSKDLYQKHTLKAGETRSFAADYQITASGDFAPAIRAEIARKALKNGAIKGVVKTAGGKIVNDAAVVAYAKGAPYGWTLGTDGAYTLPLPAGEYEVYATGKAYSRSARKKITIAAGKTQTLDFTDLKAPGRAEFLVSDAKTGKPRDARIDIAKGDSPLIEFLGSRAFFTEIGSRGKVAFAIAPGSYQFAVKSGADFLSQKKLIDVEILPEKTERIAAKIDYVTYPTAKGWYAGDLHHHSNVLEGTTPPEFVARAQVAAGLDVTFLSDHDSTINHKEMQKLSDQLGVTFIPSVELSASWGHFNPFPIKLGGEIKTDAGVDDVHAIFADARRLGAIVIPTNHPYIPYGYLRTLKEGTAKGGFNPDLDLIEINAESKYGKAIEKARDFWNKGIAIYYTAGSDAHDVWNDHTGLNRLVVYTGGKPSPESFGYAAKSGRSYVTFGPMIYPQDVMFGDKLKLSDDRPRTMSFELTSPAGLKSATLIGPTGTIESQPITGQKAKVSFAVPAADGWVALIIEDNAKKKAFSNPIWTKVTTKAMFE